jgi:hypothetical protein
MRCSTRSAFQKWAVTAGGDEKSGVAGPPRMRAGVRRVGLAGAGQEEAVPLTAVAGELAGVDTCGETTTVTKGGDVPEREEEREEAQENEDFTSELTVRSPEAGEERGGRNRRETAPETEKGTANYARFTGCRLDSLH